MPLTARKVETVKEPGMYGDGAGLYLRVGPTGAKSWILRTVVHGKRRELGLGGQSWVSLAEAREEARKLRKVAREGGDPDTVRKRETLTFWEAAEKVHAGLLPTWKNAKHAETWLQTVRTHAKPAFGNRPIETVGTADVLAILTPIWTEKHETAKRLRQRLGTIFDWARGAGHYPGENPINGLKKALPNVKHRADHMASMPWQDVPAFVSELRERDSMSSRCLEFIILTAVRSGEARGARWSEIDFDKATWTVPAERMKRGLPHRVPLSDQALEVLAKVKGMDADLVFPSPTRANSRQARPLSVMAFKPILRRMKREDVTVHGFRSSFRDWASECAHAPREVAEAALSHATGNSVEQAYARSDLFERRCLLMDRWGKYVAERNAKLVRIA
ncbi:tyrosine-type recombinase/integrase [Wenxinia saemankumensis]|uniref:Integrase n=1 Tax=Wenxinia saemankumensis TaxID=1447782 RepID=A0A1M6HQ10_9RHOB|nr:site-specific integrase [Wenxinia saemankumensis]SHJ24236.1 Integrase [Wenxinia saemankumensis]